MADKALIAPYGLEPTRRPARSASYRRVLLCALGGVLLITQANWLLKTGPVSVKIPLHAEEALQKCRVLDIPPGPPPDFHLRKESDRFVSGTKATLIKNATIWTGGNSGKEVVTGDLLLDKGIIKAIGRVGADVIASFNVDELTSYDVEGAWVSPG